MRDIIHFSKINLILDYMIEREEIPSLVAVLADPENRDIDYTISKPYFNYFTGELMPLVEKEFINLDDPIDRAVAGVSWGGLTAIFLAVRSHVFNRVLSQSGSFWPKDGLIYMTVQEAVQYDKFSESHRWSNWKGHLNEGLKKLYEN